MLPDFLLGTIQGDELQCTRTAGVTAAKVSRNEAFDACSGGGVSVADLKVVVGSREGDDEGVLTLEYGGELGDRGVFRYAGDADGGWVCGFGRLAGEDGDFECLGCEQSAEDGGAEVAICADEGDFDEGHDGCCRERSTRGAYSWPRPVDVDVCLLKTENVRYALGVVCSLADCSMRYNYTTDPNN